jgi:putative endonuclease
MRNVTFRGGELDIVALDGDELVILEVRVRTKGKVQSPTESVGPRKVKRLLRAGSLLVERLEWDGPWRLDVMGITLGGDVAKGYECEYIKDITLGMI